MIKVLPFAVAAALVLAAASQASASEVQPSLRPAAANAGASPQVPDEATRRAWFAHAVDDILSGRTAPAGTGPQR